MVNYTCKNKQCNFDEYFEDGLAPLTCPDCGGKSCSLRFCKEVKKKTRFVNIGYKDNPRWSWSMGVNPADVPVMMEKYPDRKYRSDTGQLLVESRPHKKKLMKEHDMYEMS